MTDTPSAQAVAKMLDAVSMYCGHTGRADADGNCPECVLIARSCASVAPLPPPSATATEEAEGIFRAWAGPRARELGIPVYDQPELVAAIAQALDARTAEAQMPECTCGEDDQPCPLYAYVEHAEELVRKLRARTAQMEQEIARLTKEAEEFKRDMSL